MEDLLKAMRAAFDEARKTAPSILLLDELDFIESRDEQLGDHASYQRQVVNGLLKCLDGATARPGSSWSAQRTTGTRSTQR